MENTVKTYVSAKSFCRPGSVFTGYFFIGVQFGYGQCHSHGEGWC